LTFSHLQLLLLSHSRQNWSSYYRPFSQTLENYSLHAHHRDDGHDCDDSREPFIYSKELAENKEIEKIEIQLENSD
jgi:hypothetical protein